jgi:hypothetical protein
MSRRFKNLLLSSLSILLGNAAQARVAVYDCRSSNVTVGGGAQQVQVSRSALAIDLETGEVQSVNFFKVGLTSYYSLPPSFTYEIRRMSSTRGVTYTALSAIRSGGGFATMELGLQGGFYIGANSKVLVSSAYGVESLPKTLKGNEFVGYSAEGTSFFGQSNGLAFLNIPKSQGANMGELTVRQVIDAEIAAAKSRGVLSFFGAN